MSRGKYAGWAVAGLLGLLWLGKEDPGGTSKPVVKPPVTQISSVRSQSPEPNRTPPINELKGGKNGGVNSTNWGTHASINEPAITKNPVLAKVPQVNKEPIKTEGAAQTMYVDASRLNVRSGPGKTFKSVWTIKRDEAVRVVSQSGQWKEIKGDRYSGWVFGTYLTAKPSRSQRNQEPQVATKASAQMTTVAIKKLLIERSKAYYSGSCPCPYNVTRSGRRCRGNSAYSRPGGASPLCYESDVSAAMVAEFRARM